jgi:hypothetical protein
MALTEIPHVGGAYDLAPERTKGSLLYRSTCWGLGSYGQFAYGCLESRLVLPLVTTSFVPCFELQWSNNYASPCISRWVTSYRKLVGIMCRLVTIRFDYWSFHDRVLARNIEVTCCLPPPPRSGEFFLLLGAIERVIFS